MKIEGKRVELFKIKNRKGYAAICNGCLTEGRSKEEALKRMLKALRRVKRRGCRKN